MNNPYITWVKVTIILNIDIYPVLNSNISNVYLNIKVRNGFLPCINNFTMNQKLELIKFLLIKEFIN